MEKADASGLDTRKLKEATRCVRKGVAETLAYTKFPMEH